MIKEGEISTLKQALHYIYELEIKNKKLEDRIKELEQIEEEHKKINSELMKKLTSEEMLDDLEKRYEVYGKRK